MKQIKYTGKEDCVIEILDNLPSHTNAVRRLGESIVIPTRNGAKQVFVGDTVVIVGENITIIEK
jgi:hypothetical protein